MAKTSRKLHWWLFSLIVFVVFVLLQVPAAWLIAKFYKNNHVIHNVSGNIWHGQADWKQGDLRGVLTWTSQPWELLRLRVAAHVVLDSGESSLQGQVAYGLGQTFYMQKLHGEIAPETLKQFAAWQWPNHPIRLEQVNLKFKQGQGFIQADGKLQWNAGPLSYVFAQRQEHIDLPQLLATIRDEQNKLVVDVRDAREQKMLNLSLDSQLMLDVQLTQRLLLNSPSYTGKAGLDTYVISTRQPLLKGAY